MFIMGTRCMAEVLFGVIGSTNVMFAFWQNNSAATHVCKNIPHCSWLRCVWQLWMDTDFGSFADKASLKQTHKQIGMVTARLHIWILRMEMWRWIVQQRVAQNLGMARSQTPRLTKYEIQNEKQNTIKSNKSICMYFAGILRVFCGYSAGILQVFCGIYGLCFSRAILLWICKGFAGRDGGWREGGHESLRWRPTCEAGSLLEISGSSGLIQGHPPPFQECSKLFWHALSHEWRQQLHESISMLLATASKSWSLVLDALQVLDAPLVPPYLWPADPTAIRLLQKTMPITNPSFSIISNNVICGCFDGILLKPCLLQPCFHVAGTFLRSFKDSWERTRHLGRRGALPADYAQSAY